MLGTSRPPKGKSPQAKEKRPPLTHFLCFPLVTETSLPLLEKSFSHFRDNIPQRRKTMTDHSLKPRPPLFPDSAIRPVGTLHLTLGVMSLTTRDRLDEATSFLDSLDIEQMLRETTSNDADISQQQQQSAEEENSLAPISVSLQSLYALPKAKAATVLYAKPVDPTSRLYPLGVKLRERFVEAGLIQPDFLKTKPRKGSKVIDNNNTSQNDIPAQAETPKPKLRPLLLHATIVNTIYARGGHSAQNRGKDRRRGGPLTFDARDMLTHHHDFYTDDTCVEAKKHDVSDSSFLEDAESDRSSESNDEPSSSMSTQEEAHPSRTVQQITPETTDNEKYPFVWARNFHIEKVCICEMGAKAVVDGDGDPLGARLGQKYRVVAERSLPSF
ncbi:uncharacterized protein TRUGW13939_02751 [Talaromyces rugulosus]|uniref:A-kinase anchor protein 7-like phosphoesterase domain-containing protein n=1 Tax=Talaromyces rugulosus TaxID=121627 RepID=A0A7H8QNW8_TALRU|nr:uncharacterized protein TRUGW13939_02751 [Talaromyces rugulosus]QKX55654.1 hypothetical protein TRUGW13939_02751 [Talaromyces rugulosus]